MRPLATLVLVPGLVIGLGAPARADVEVKSDHYDIVAPDADVAKAKRAELEWSAGLFEDLFAVAPPRGRVTFGAGAPGPGGGMMPPMAGGGAGAGGGAAVWTLPWFTGALPGVPAGMASQMKALTHEAAHLQLLHLVNDGCAADLKASFNGYGSFLPDWVDECVAVYHEPGGQKKERRGQLKAAVGSGKHIPLAKLFTMAHPIGGKGPGGLPPGLVPPGGGGGPGVGGGVIPGGGAGLEEANTYYVECLSVIEYLCDRAGKPFFRFCVSRLQQGKSMDDVLREWHERRKDIEKLVKEARKPAPKGGGKPKAEPEGDDGATKPRGEEDDASDLAAVLRLRKGEAAGPLPKTVALLEQDWLRWVKAKYPGYDPRLPPCPD